VTERFSDAGTQVVADAVEQMLPLMTRFSRLYVSDDAEVAAAIERAWIDTLRSVGDDRTSLRVRVVRSLVRLLERDGEPRPRQGAADRRLERSSQPARVDADRFLPPQHPVWPGHWAEPPRHPRELPILSGTAGVRVFVRSALQAIPLLEAEVLLLRDVERWNAAEVCETLNVSDLEQRALLHSGRERVRRALEGYPGRN
jgi:RNA polymerase sigma-70 factor, ECF subfamily